MSNKTAIALMPYLNVPVVLHPDDEERWNESDVDRLIELRNELIELDLPGIDVQYLGDTPGGHPVHIELIDTGFPAGEIYMQFRTDLLNGCAHNDISTYIALAKEITSLRESKEGAT